MGEEGGGEKEMNGSDGRRRWKPGKGEIEKKRKWE